MSLELINPSELRTPDSYTHVVVATGGRFVFVAGQVADNPDGDLATQARLAFANVGRCLAAVGARPDQVARITIYVIGLKPEDLPVIEAGRVAVFGDHKPADTLLGVQTLAEQGYLIEVEAIAVI
jgi:enamine deaminase RidA (YjgF/YER057c/UK114 family)